MKSFTLSKREIARTSRELQPAFKHGRRHRKNGLLLVCAESECRKVCFIVKKRVGNAVKRNRLKRWMREFYRLQQHTLPQGSTYIWVVEKSSNPVNGGREQFQTLMKELLEQAVQ